MVERVGRSDKKNKIECVRFVIFNGGSKNELLVALNEMSNKAPLSKFGIDPVFEIRPTSAVNFYNDFYCFYTERNTSKKVGEFTLEDGIKKASIFSKINVDLDERDYE